MSKIKEELLIKKLKQLNYLSYNDYKTNYSIYKNHSQCQWFLSLWSFFVRTPEYPDETHLSDMVTSSHADAGYQIAVAVVRGKRRVTFA